jgi:hypothetical protein
MSATLPIGTRNIAAASKYDVPTQLSSTALIENSLPTLRRATFIAEAINGVRNELSAATSRATDLVVESLGDWFIVLLLTFVWQRERL